VAGGSDRQAEGPPELPEAPVDRLVEPVARFLHVEAASGIVLLAATVVALALANSPLGGAFLALWKTPVALSIGGFTLDHSLKHWINDGLMAIFFFVVGLEVKRELVLGELRDPRRAALPIAGALGGMIVPAAIYLALQAGEPGEHGWGIPMATDIAFVVGCLALLGPRVPSSLRVMLLSLAIVDDIGAILVIAVGYTEGLNVVAFGLAAAGLGFVFGLSYLGVRALAIYFAVGAAVWLALHESGVHATLAGVVLGVMTPARPNVSTSFAANAFRRASEFLRGDPEPEPPKQALRRVEKTAREARAPLERLENALHPWVSFVIMPLFALANAGVAFSPRDLGDPVALAVAAGLVVGKPAGVVGFAFLAVRLGLARLPDGLGWGVMVGAGLLAGIGFTMALFIAGLALDGPLLDAAKVGILGASAACGVAGMALLRARLPGRRERAAG
jgi:NhaA family Na+:H+ antiporter